MSPSRRASRNQPQSRTVENLLQRGIELHQAGRGKEAAGLYQQILRLDGNHPAANHLFGLSQLQQGDVTAAIRHIALALKAQPANPQYLSNMGVALTSAGRSDEAVEVLQRAVAINPASAEAYSNLGMANRALGRFREAAEAYRHASELRPAEPTFHYRLANALRHAGDHFAAEASYRRAIELRPGYVEAYDRLALILVDQGRTDEALELLDRALAILPSAAELYVQRALALYARGDLGASVADLDRAIALRPSYGEAHLHRSKMVRYARRDGSVAVMEKLFRSEDAAANDRIPAGFGLGKALADIGDHLDSISTFVEANRMQRLRVPFSLSREADYMRTDLDRFRDVEFPVSDHESPAPSPIFIVGLPRAGKTTLERILSAHPSLAGAGELPTLGRLARDFVRDAKGMEFPKLPLSRFAELGAAYMREAERLVPSGRRLIDTMPANYYHLGFIRLALPNARVIHCVRPQADHRIAIFEKLFSAPGYEYANDLQDLVSYHGAYSRMMSSWHARFPGFIHDVDVGALMADRRALAEDLLQFCGVAWDDAVIAPAQSEPQYGDWSSDQRAANHLAHMTAWRQFHPQLWT